MAKKVIRHIGDSQKNIIRMMDSVSARHSRWEVWNDFIVMSAISIANTFKGPYREEREERYLGLAGKYSGKELEIIAAMFAEVVDAMDVNPDQDFLGELFMALGLGNEWAGQFFTPYDVCRVMARMSMAPDPGAEIQKKGWVAVSDPACGAGALLLAFANECRREGINYQTSVLFVAQDIDFLAGCMCYIQMSLMGCPGYVVIDDTLTNPSVCYDRRGLIPQDKGSVWYTPMYFSDIWQWRRTFSQLDTLCRHSAEENPREKPMPRADTRQKAAPVPTAVPVHMETETGQLTLL